MYSIENLYHFNCSNCKKWFSIGDYNKTYPEVYCPWCNNKEEHKENEQLHKNKYIYFCNKCNSPNTFEYELDRNKDIIHCFACGYSGKPLLNRFKINDKVEKFTGDYKVTGTIVSVFNKLSKETRVVVECDEPKGLLLIFNTEQIRQCEK